MLQSRVDAGLGDHLALARRNIPLNRPGAEIPPIRKNIEETKNTLAVLAGRVPGKP